MTYPVVDTVFTQGTTITSEWLNGVNDYVNESNPSDHSAANVTYDPPFTGAVATNVEAKLAQTVSVKDFGAVGDGVTDDRTAIVNALTAAAGRTVLLESGKTYKVGSAIVFNGDVCIDTDGVEKAVIFHNGQSFIPLTITGALAVTKTLSASQQVNNRGWDFSNVTGISAGMLMEVISDAKWYNDPRVTSTDARKSELHRVGYISGTTVYSEDPANDGYNVTSGAEVVTVNFYNPVNVNINNIEVRCVLPTPATSTPAVGGLKLVYTNEAIVNETNVVGAAAVGISIGSSYRAVVSGGHTHSANDFYTGYGVQIYSSSHCVVRGRTFWQCRRGVDVSGANVISRHTLIENNVNLGGGVNSQGTVYGWTDGGVLGAPQYGFGSHGPTDHTIYRGNRIAQMHTPINCRGRNEVIEGNYIVGRTRSGAISLSFGQNYWIRNNIVYTGWTNIKDNTNYETVANINNSRCDYFVEVGASVQDGPLLIENNDVQVQDRFVNFATDGTGVKTVTITGGGSNFINGEQITVTANDGTGTGGLGIANVTAGAITSVTMFYYGSGYTLGENLTITSLNNSGSGATGTVGSLNNTVITKVTLKGNKIRFATGSGATNTYVAYNENGAAANVSDWTIQNNDYARVGGTGSVNMFYNLTLGSSRLVDGQSYSADWTPTVTLGSNMTAASASYTRFIRVGNCVQFFGAIQIQATTIGLAQVELTPPIATSFGSFREVLGSAVSIQGTYNDVGSISASTTNNTIFLRLNATTTSTYTWQFSGSYTV